MLEASGGSWMGGGKGGLGGEGGDGRGGGGGEGEGGTLGVDGEGGEGSGVEGGGDGGTRGALERPGGREWAWGERVSGGGRNSANLVVTVKFSHKIACCNSRRWPNQQSGSNEWVAAF